MSEKTEPKAPLSAEIPIYRDADGDLWRMAPHPNGPPNIWHRVYVSEIPFPEPATDEARDRRVPRYDDVKIEMAPNHVIYPSPAEIAEGRREAWKAEEAKAAEPARKGLASQVDDLREAVASLKHTCEALIEDDSETRRALRALASFVGAGPEVLGEK